MSLSVNSSQISPAIPFLPLLVWSPSLKERVANLKLNEAIDAFPECLEELEKFIASIQVRVKEPLTHSSEINAVELQLDLIDQFNALLSIYDKNNNACDRFLEKYNISSELLESIAENPLDENELKILAADISSTIQKSHKNIFIPFDLKSGDKEELEEASQEAQKIYAQNFSKFLESLTECEKISDEIAKFASTKL